MRYDSSSGEYVFEIPDKDGKRGREEMRAEVAVHPEELIEQRFGKTIREAKKAGALLESDLADQAAIYVGDCLEVLAATDEKTLREGAGKFIHATTAIADFQAFTHLTGKGLRSALRLHSKAYDRYMENLFNAVIEFVFWWGGDITENITKRLIKGEKEVLEAQLKANAKTLSEAAAESAETVVGQLKQKAKAVLEQLETQMKKLRTEASELIAKLRSQIDSLAHTRKEIGEKVARGEVLESQIKQLDHEIGELGKHADDLSKQVAEVEGKAVDLRAARKNVERNIDAAGQDLRRLEGELSDGAGEVRRLQNGVRELDSEIDQARSLVDGKKANAAGARQQLESAEGRLKRLQGEKARTDTQLRSLEKEQAAIDAAVENGTATQAQMKRLNDLPDDRNAAAEQLLQVEGDIKAQSDIVSSKQAQLAQADAQAEAAAGKLEGLQSQSPRLRGQLSEAERTKAALERKVDSKRAQLDDFNRKNADLVSEEQTLLDQGDKIRGQLDGVGEQTKAKDAAARAKTDELAAVERERAALVARHDELAREMDATAGQFRENRQSATELIDPLADGHAEVANLDSQAQVLEAIRNRPKGVSPEEYIAQLRAKIDALPSDSSIGRRVSDKLTGDVGLDDYRKMIEDIQNKIPPEMPVAHRTQIGKNLDRMRDAMRGAVQTVQNTEMDNAIKKVLLQQTFDSIKGGINDRAAKLEQVAHSDRFKNLQQKSLVDVWNSVVERIEQRAKEIRKAIQEITRSDYKATDAKFYEDIPWGSVYAKVDEGIEYLAGFWNDLLEYGVEKHAELQKEFPTAMAFAENLVLYGISIAVEVLDRLIRIVQWLLDKLIDAASSRGFAISLLNRQARKEAAKSEGMPSTLVRPFFAFSSEMVAELTKAAALVNLVDYPSEDAARAVKQPFTGARAKHYERQWDTARDHLIATAKHTLRKEWLEDSQVNAAYGRQSTELLQRVVRPLADFAGSFDTAKEGGLVTAFTVWETGTLTPQDVDTVIDSAGWTASMSLKIGGLILAFTPYAPSVPAMMLAADRMDWLTAGLRVACSTFMTNPAILGAQFDIMSVFNLGYRARFLGKDLGDCLAPEPLPAFDEFAMVP